jgi:alpha-1,2-mannosyltransferase
MLVLEPVLSTVAYGQLNVIRCAMVLTALDRRGQKDAVWLGLATAMKLTPAVFLVPLLFRGSWRRCTAALVMSVLATGVGFLVLPAQSARYLGSTIWQVERIGAMAYAGNQSVNGFVRRALPHGGGTTFWVLCVLVVTTIVVLTNARTSSMPVAAGSAALGGLLASPISWTHHGVLAGPVALLVWRMRVPFWSRSLASSSGHCSSSSCTPVGRCAVMRAAEATSRTRQPCRRPCGRRPAEVRLG